MELESSPSYLPVCISFPFCDFFLSLESNSSCGHKMLPAHQGNFLSVGFYSCLAETWVSTGYKVLWTHYYRINFVQIRFLFCFKSCLSMQTLSSLAACLQYNTAVSPEGQGRMM